MAPVAGVTTTVAASWKTVMMAVAEVEVPSRTVVTVMVACPWERPDTTPEELTVAMASVEELQLKVWPATVAPEPSVTFPVRDVVAPVAS